MPTFRKQATEGELAAASWRDRLSRIARNLTDFRETGACRRVMARKQGGGIPYTGKTEEAAQKAIDAFNRLWQEYAVLSRVVDAAWELASKSGLLVDNTTEVLAMLEGESVALPSVSIPVHERGLLDSPEINDKAKPADVLASMTATFEIAKATITAINGASEGLEKRLESTRARIAEMAAWTANTGIVRTWTADAIAAIMDTENDPMGALERLSLTEKSVEAAWAEYEKKRTDTEKANAGIVKVSVEIDACALEWTRASKELKAAAKEFEGTPFPLDRCQKRISDLNDWQDRLAKTGAEGRPEAALLGLERLSKVAEATLVEARAVIATVEFARKARDDISGRLRALRAKAAATGMTDAKTAGLGDAAKAECARVPFRPAMASEAVNNYEKALEAGRI